MRGSGSWRQQKIPVEVDTVATILALVAGGDLKISGEDD